MDFSKLFNNFSEQVKLAKELLLILEEEPKVLTSNNHKAIIELSSNKQRLAEKLAAGENERRLILEEYQLPLDLKELEAELNKIGDESAAIICQKLREVALSCFEYNRNNGILIENRLIHTLKALEIVAGQSMEYSVFDKPIYGGNRSRLIQSSRRSWGKA